MITGRTTVAAVIGNPIGHSLSPAIHNAAFEAAGLDWVYVALPVSADHATDAVVAMRTLRLGGMSVTMPHKDIVATVADERSPAVLRLGAANCLVPVGDGRIRAESTDGPGFLAGLAHDAGISVKGLRVAILGAGGAARAIALACAEAGAAAVLVINRTETRAEATASMAGRVGRVAGLDDLASVDLVVNATPIGMGSGTSLPCDPALLHKGQVVVDLIYNPLETAWVQALRAAGIDAHNGLSMLVHQAAIAFTHWTGVPAPVGVMRRAVANNLL